MRAQTDGLNDGAYWLKRPFQSTTRIVSSLKSLLPPGLRGWLGERKKAVLCWSRVRRLRYSTLQTVMPISRVFGLDRGKSLCRYYIEGFLNRNAGDIHGCVLEIADNKYTRIFGADRVSRSEVLHVQEGIPGATIVADLTAPNHIPSDTFDCIILTQTLQFIYHTRAAIQTLYRILKPGGVLLATIPGISQISRYDMDRWGEYWRFTTLSVRKLAEEEFPAANIEVISHGNVLVANAYLYGLTVEDLSPRQLSYQDPDYEMLITVRAVKPSGNV
jgi:SAM-dependent methyltransferase